MSLCTYFASDWPLASRPNPHDRLLSVNEALAAGVTDIPEFLLESDFDRDQPGVLLVSDREVVIDVDCGEIRDGSLDDDFSIRESSSCMGMFTDKKYTADLEWSYYTEGRAKQVIAYISRHLEQADEVELWQIWMGIGDRPLIRSRAIALRDLKPDHIRELVERKVWSETVTEYEIPVQYRLVITKE